MKKILPSVFFAAHFMMCNCASAAEAYISAIPTSWRLQNYIPDTPTLFFSGSNCGPSGILAMPANATKADRDRLYNTIMAAKLAKKPVFIFYESTTCTINSFGLLEQPN